MKPVIIGFSKHRGFAIGSELICLFMNTPYSHTYFKFKDDLYSDATIFNAVGKGLIYISETKFLEGNEPVFEKEIQVSDTTYDELLIDCHNNAGTGYGFLQNLGIAWVSLLNKIGIKTDKNPIDDGINCSEWMYYLLTEVYGTWTTEDHNLITPKDVYDFVINK